MPLTHTNLSGSALVNAVVSRIDTGGGTSVISWQTAANAELCVTNLPNPAFTVATVKTSSLNGVPLTSSGATAGTVTQAVFKNRAVTEEFRCAVSTSGSDINLSGNVMAASETITLNSFSYSVT